MMSRINILRQELTNRGFVLEYINIIDARCSKDNMWLVLEKDNIEGTYMIGTYDQKLGDFVQGAVYENESLTHARVQYYRYVALLMSMGYMEYN